MLKRKILIIGSTGSIGKQTLEVIKNQKELFEVEGIACNHNIDLILEQSREWNIKKVAVADESKYSDEYKDWYWGEEELEEMIRDSEADLVVMAISGAKSLKPTLTAIEAGKNVALASKEVMVLAGEIINQKAVEKGVNILPIDSEHSAIWQSLRSGKKEEIEQIILTCSGGPFLKWKSQDFKNIKKEDALKHPNWNMGQRITIDSSTLMNKGLEFIEAKWLFGIPEEKIKVIIHPQSIIHSAIQYRDGSVISQMGDKDMRIAIQYAINYPDRIKNDLKRLDWANLKLDFEEPNLAKFPCLDLAIKASEIGGTMPVVLNAADEVAVDLFLKDKISFLEIPKIVEEMMRKHHSIQNPNINQILEIDRLTREEINYD